MKLDIELQVYHYARISLDLHRTCIYAYYLCEKEPLNNDNYVDSKA